MCQAKVARNFVRAPARGAHLESTTNCLVETPLTVAADVRRL